MLDITRRKNHDYSGTELAFRNFEFVEALWICWTEEWIMVRITDKLTRLSNLLHTEAMVKDESILDTILDCANYLLILRIYLETKNL